MAWIGLWQKLFQPSDVGTSFCRVCSLIEPVEKFFVKIDDLVPIGLEFVPVRRWFIRHRSASVLSVPNRDEAFSLRRARSPTFPIAFGGHHASLPAFFSLVVGIASFSMVHSRGCDRGPAYVAHASPFPPLLRPQQGTPRDNKA